MELNTQLNSKKSQVDTVRRMHYDAAEGNKIIVYFDKHFVIGGEVSETFFDTASPVTLEITEEVASALNILFLRAFDVRKKQLATQNSALTDLVPLIKPNYKEFYSDLLITELFAIARQMADTDLQINTAYTDFAIALTNAIGNNENVIGLQVSLNKMLQVLGKNVQTSHLEVLDGLLKKHHLSIVRI